MKKTADMSKVNTRLVLTHARNIFHKRSLSCIVLLLNTLYFINPYSALASDPERIQKLEDELEARHVKQYLQSFENYFNFLGTEGRTDDMMAANSMVSSLNALTQKYATVNDLYTLVAELSESGYYKESTPMLLGNFYASLQVVRGYGFGTGKVGSWQFKHMTRFGNLNSVAGSGKCRQQIENVFYTTIKHNSKNYQFGFYLSSGYGFVNEKMIQGKSLNEPCI